MKKPSKLLHKLFMGIVLTPDLAYELLHSTLWKNYSIIHGNNPGRIVRIPFQKKEYLGVYFEEDKIPWSKICSESKRLQTDYQTFFPEVAVDKLPITLLTQELLP